MILMYHDAISRDLTSLDLVILRELFMILFFSDFGD